MYRELPFTPQPDLKTVVGTLYQVPEVQTETLQEKQYVKVLHHRAEVSNMNLRIAARADILQMIDLQVKRAKAKNAAEAVLVVEFLAGTMILLSCSSLNVSKA